MTGQILCPQYGISVAESQMFLLLICPLVVMRMKKSLLLQAKCGEFWFDQEIISL